MLVSNQKIRIKWGRTNVTYYRELGYEFTKLGEYFHVKAEDLMPTSKALVEITCDSCGKKCVSTYQSYLSSFTSHKGKYFCKSCVQKLPEVKSKKEDSCLKKYGFNNVAQNDSVKNKIKETNLFKNGYAYPTQSPIVKEKIKEAYKRNETFCGFQNPDVLRKAQEKISENCSHKVSSQQLLLFQYIKKNFLSTTECELNKQCSTLNLDISLELESQKIDIEVDGIYWHKDEAKDRRRDEYVKQHGYKVLRIKIDHKLPPFDEICAAIYKLINSEHSFYTIKAKDVKQTK